MRVAALMEQVRPSHPEFRWVAAEALHLTIKFLGDIDPARVPDAAQAAAAACGRQPGAVEWSLVGTGCFGSPHRARVVWLGVDDPTGSVTRLHEALDAELAARGFPPERRRFSPHLTLGRSRSEAGGDATWLSAWSDVSFGATRSHELLLVKSTLTNRGPIYETLQKFKIGKK